MQCHKNITIQEIFATCMESNQEPYLHGAMKEESKASEQTEDIDDILYQEIRRIKEAYVTAESQPINKKKIWKDKLSISDLNILTMKLSEILDQASISSEKDLIPFWNQRSKATSKKLWLPTEIDCVDSVLSSSKKCYQAQMGASWFSIKKKHPHNKRSSMTSFQLSQYSLPESMDCGATPLKRKLGAQPLKFKTLKFRIFPTQEEMTKLQKCLDQYRWYYNATVSVIYNEDNFKSLFIKDTNKICNHKVRDHMRKYIFKEEVCGDKINKYFLHDEENNAPPVPDWWINDVHSEIPRGASSKFTSSLNSGLTNLKQKNISKFSMRFMSRKNPTEYLHFDDKNYPAFIRKIKSHYWFRNNHKRTTIAYRDINSDKGLEIIHDKLTDKWYLHCPVDINWYPDDDKRNEKQATLNHQGERIIALDPGIRKFLVGYDPTGQIIFIGENAQHVLINLLLEIDKCKDINESKLLWSKIKHMIDDLHWKSISFLIENYDVILFPDFRIQQMIKSIKLSKQTKRLMVMYSFFKFKQRLEFKCKMHNKKLFIVDESYTSKICTCCGILNDTKGKETLICELCKLMIDRDVNGSRNIFIKNVSYAGIQLVSASFF